MSSFDEEAAKASLVTDAVHGAAADVKILHANLAPRVRVPIIAIWFAPSRGYGPGIAKHDPNDSDTAGHSQQHQRSCPLRGHWPRRGRL